MALRRITAFALLVVLFGVVTSGAEAVATARTWSVTPTDDVDPGDALTFTGSGCVKRGVPSGHMEIVIETNYGLLGYVPVSANGTWRLVTRVSPSPGSFLMVLHASCFDDGGHTATAGAKLFFKYPQVLAVHYTGGLSLTAFPIHAVEDTPLKTAVAFFTYPTATGVPAPAPKEFTATVRWADGDTTPAQVIAVTLGYEVIGRHTYSSPRTDEIKVTVRPPRSKKAVSRTGAIVVDPIHPSGAFDVNPTNPEKYGIALLMPRQSAPWQNKITQWQWTFSRDSNPVTDAPTPHAAIDSVVQDLLRQPGDAANRNAAVLKGILPQCVTALIGCLDDKDIRQIATVWQEYFPQHVVPHVFTSTGHTQVTLTVVDEHALPLLQSRHTSADVNVTPTCHPWGGPLNGWFNGYTTCHTWNGFKAQFGEHRVADYVSIGVSKEAPTALTKLTAGGGVAIVVTRGVFDERKAAASVFLTVHLHEGVGLEFASLPYGATLAQGWLGPPDPAHTPSSSDAINAFAGGAQISAGFNLGLVGWHGVASPSTGQAGEEQFFGVAGISADAGIACSWPLPQLASNPTRLQQLLTTTGNPKHPPDAAAIDAARKAIAGALATVPLGEYGIDAILSCL